MIIKHFKQYFCSQLCINLKQRGLIYQQTHDKIPDCLGPQLQGSIALQQSPIAIESYSQYQLSAYCGFDPTAPSLHLGNLLAILMLIRVQIFGYKPIALVGGATGMIGDPSGKQSEREQQSLEIVKSNTNSINNQIEAIFGNASRIAGTVGQLQIISNLEFYEKMNCLHFLRDVGSSFRVSSLLQREMVQQRISTDGLSYTEFSYALLQAYDFSQLFERHNCVLQLGGSDQWGNITGGCDYVRRKYGMSVFGLTSPLLVDRRGRKFGKSEGNALFLDESMTARDEMSQYLLNQPDDMVEDLLLKLTFLNLQEIKDYNKIMIIHNYKLSERIAQNRLNIELQKIIYGEVQEATSARLHKLDWTQLGEEDLQGIETIRLDRQYLNTLSLIELLVHSQLVVNKSEGKRMLEMGGVYLSNKRIKIAESKNMNLLLNQNLLNDRYLIFRIGKKEYKVIELI